MKDSSSLRLKLIRAVSVLVACAGLVVLGQLTAPSGVRVGYEVETGDRQLSVEITYRTPNGQFVGLTAATPWHSTELAFPNGAKVELDSKIPGLYAPANNLVCSIYTSGYFLQTSALGSGTACASAGTVHAVP